MDKDKVMRYAGLGLLGGWMGGILWVFMIYGEWAGDILDRLILPMLIISIVGGIIGGVITKKWWGAMLGGIILQAVLQLNQVIIPSLM